MIPNYVKIKKVSPALFSLSLPVAILYITAYFIKDHHNDKQNVFLCLLTVTIFNNAQKQTKVNIHMHLLPKIASVDRSVDRWVGVARAGWWWYHLWWWICLFKSRVGGDWLLFCTGGWCNFSVWCPHGPSRRAHASSRARALQSHDKPPVSHNRRLTCGGDFRRGVADVKKKQKKNVIQRSL